MAFSASSHSVVDAKRGINFQMGVCRSCFVHTKSFNAVFAEYRSVALIQESFERTSNGVAGFIMFEVEVLFPLKGC